MKTRDQRQEQLQDFGPLFTGELLRDEGIAKVSSNNESWMAVALESAEYFVSTCDGEMRHRTFTGEDIRHHCSGSAGCPAHSNAWGALINTLLKRKIITPTGEYRAMRDDNSHARKTPVYHRLSRCEPSNTVKTSNQQ